MLTNVHKKGKQDQDIIDATRFEKEQGNSMEEKTTLVLWWFLKTSHIFTATDMHGTKLFVLGGHVQ